MTSVIIHRAEWETLYDYRSSQVTQQGSRSSQQPDHLTPPPGCVTLTRKSSVYLQKCLQKWQKFKINGDNWVAYYCTLSVCVCFLLYGDGTVFTHLLDDKQLVFIATCFGVMHASHARFGGCARHRTGGGGKDTSWELEYHFSQY